MHFPAQFARPQHILFPRNRKYSSHFRAWARVMLIVGWYPGETAVVPLKRPREYEPCRCRQLGRQILPVGGESDFGITRSGVNVRQE
jgi:hypothetical protein